MICILMHIDKFRIFTDTFDHQWASKIAHAEFGGHLGSGMLDTVEKMLQTHFPAHTDNN